MHQYVPNLQDPRKWVQRLQLQIELRLLMQFYFNKIEEQSEQFQVN